MIRVILLWAVLFSVFAAGIHAWRSWFRKDVLHDGFMLVIQALAAATLTTAVLFAIVAIF